MKKENKVVKLLYKWGARIVMAVGFFAGMMTFLEPVDRVISIPTSLVITFLLLREID